MNNLTSKKLRTYLDGLSKKGLDRNTYLRKLASIEKFLTWALQKGVLKKNIFSELNGILRERYVQLEAEISHSAQTSLPQSPQNTLKAHFLIENKVIAVTLGTFFLLATVAIFGKTNHAVPQRIKAETAASRSLSFQGRLTDPEGNPIDNPTNVIIKIYNNKDSGRELYTSGTCFVTPDPQGYFAVTLGKTCGSKIPNALFTENQNTYLGVSVGTDPEMRPRYALANTGLASNSLTLGDSPKGTTASTVPYIDTDGNITLDVPEAGIKAVGESANFTIASGKSLNLETGRSGNLTLSAGNLGNLIFKTGGIIGATMSGTGATKFTGDTTFGGTFANNVTFNSSNIYISNPSNFDVANSSPTALTMESGLLTIDTLNGRIGVGGIDPQEKLDVKGDIRVGTGTTGCIKRADGSIITGTCTSDIRLKKDVTSITSVLEKLTKLNPVTFQWRQDEFPNSGFGAGTQTGLIAQDVEQVFPELVSTDKNGFKNVDYGPRLTLYNIQATKELTQRLNDLGQKITVDQIDDPSTVTIENTESQSLDQNSISAENLQQQAKGFLIKNSVGDLFQKIVGFSDIFAARMTTGFIKTQNAVVDQYFVAKIITTEWVKGEVADFQKASVDIFTASYAKIADLTTDTLTVNKKLVSPVLNADQIIATNVQANTIAAAQIKAKEVQTDTISSDQGSVTVDLNKKNSQEKGKLAALIIKGLNDATVASIDAEGNATFSGTLTASRVNAQNLNTHDATVSGTLIAKNIKSDNIDALTGRTSAVEESIRQAQDKTGKTAEVVSGLNNNMSDLQNRINDLAKNNTASPSAVRDQEAATRLYEQVNQIQQLLTKLQTSPLADPKFYATTLPAAAAQSKIDKKDFDNATFSGTTNLTNVYISDSLTAGNILVENDTVRTLGQELRLTALSSINLLDGAVLIAKNGNITTQGTLIAKGGVKTNEITPADGNAVTVKLPSNQNSELRIQNSDQKQVASVDALGKATFTSLTLNKFSPNATPAVLAASQNQRQNGIDSPAIETSGETAGSGILPQDSQEVVIFNDLVKDNSLIYLTPTSSMPAGQLSVVKKEACTNNEDSNCHPYFTIQLSQPVHPDITFSWLIIN